MKGNEFVLERIDEHRDSFEGTKYLVKWYGSRANDRTWEPKVNFLGHQKLRYWRMRRENPPTDDEKSRRE